jgi:N-acetylmuramoyl-L-alanine amidase
MLPISYRAYVPLRVRRRPPRRPRRTALWAVLALVPLVLLVVLVDRACGSAAPAAAGVRSASAATPPVPVPAYAAGACQAQAPTGQSRGRTVYVDPGHGGLDPGVLGQPAGAGASKARLAESQVALAVAGELVRRLRADGYRVVLSRTGDTSVRRFAAGEVDGGALSSDQVRQDLQARVRCANDSRAAALLSIHFNGYGDPAVGGSQTIYDAARPFSDRSARLARSVQSALLARLGLVDRGVLTDDALDAPTLSDRADSYGHLLLLGPAQTGWLDRGTGMPGVLVEPLFLTAPAEAGLATSGSGQRKIGTALAEGLEAFLARG